MNQIVYEKVEECNIEPVAKNVEIVVKITIAKKVHKFISSKFFKNAKKHQEQVLIENLRANKNHRYLVMF